MTWSSASSASFSEPFPLAGIVLAGGASRRMGRDKATLPFSGPLADLGGAAPSTMVEYVLATVAKRCQPLFVMAAPGQPLPPLQAEVLRDETPGVGPLLATGAGLRAAAQAGVDWAFISAVDMPFLSVDLIDALAGPTAQLQADVVLPWDGRDHYLAAVYRTSLADRVEALVAAGERSMRALVDTVDAQRIVMSGSRWLENINSQADLHSSFQPGR